MDKQTVWYTHTMEYYLPIKRNELSRYKKKHGRTLNVYRLFKEASLKRLHAIISSTLHCGIVTVKRSLVQEESGEG